MSEFFPIERRPGQFTLFNLDHVRRIEFTQRGDDGTERLYMQAEVFIQGEEDPLPLPAESAQLLFDQLVQLDFSGAYD